MTASTKPLAGTVLSEDMYIESKVPRVGTLRVIRELDLGDPEATVADVTAGATYRVELHRADGTVVIVVPSCHPCAQKPANRPHVDRALRRLFQPEHERENES